MYKGLRGLQKSSEVLYDLWLGSQEFCCYEFHDQQLVSGRSKGAAWVALMTMGLVKEFKISQELMYVRGLPDRY